MAYSLAPLFALVALFFLRIAHPLLRNIATAKATNLRYVVVPYTELDHVAFILSPLQRLLCSGRLAKGKGWPGWMRFTVKDWSYEDRGRAFEQYGPAFTVVAPSGIVVYVSNSHAVSKICTNRRVFVKPRKKFAILNVFGPNAASSDGDVWKRHQRLILPALGDWVHHLVWDEASRQASVMGAAWLAQGFGDADQGMAKLTLNVTTYAEYGKRIEWDSVNEAPPPGFSMHLVDAIAVIVTDFASIFLLHRRLLRFSPWRKAYRAIIEYEKYLNQLLDGNNEKQRTSQPTILAKMQEQMRPAEGKDVPTRDEILSNLFVFHFASYDTTSIALCYALLVLSFEKGVQDCVANEVDRVWQEAQQAGRTALSYAADFPKLRYTLALMYEVLRVFPIVLPITRAVAQDTTLKIGQGSQVLPAGANVVIPTTAVNNSSKSWPEPQVIEPLRWLQPAPNEWDPIRDKNSPDETVPIPNNRKGTFLTFNEGPHSCLGRKVAQTEFVAVVAELVLKYRVELANGMAPEEVKRHLFLRAKPTPVTLAAPMEARFELVPRK